MQGSVVVILVVEDDPLIQEMVADSLTEGGFETVLVPTGEEAVTLLQTDKSKYRALVTDINLLGRLNGWEVGHRAREICPEIPVIYMTGSEADQWTAHGVPPSVLLNKPFAPAQIVAAVAQLLNTGAPPT